MPPHQDDAVFSGIAVKRGVSEAELLTDLKGLSVAEGIESTVVVGFTGTDFGDQLGYSVLVDIIDQIADLIELRMMR